MRQGKTSTNPNSDSDMSGTGSNRPVDLDHTEITPLDDCVEKGSHDVKLEDTPTNVDNIEPAEYTTKTSSQQ